MSISKVINRAHLSPNVAMASNTEAVSSSTRVVLHLLTRMDSIFLENRNQAFVNKDIGD